MKHAGVDRLAALQLAIELVRRGGTISLAGVYGGMTDPLPMMVLFDKQIQLRMGQANVRRWIDDILPLVTDDDVLARRGLRQPPPAARRRPEGLRDLPEEAGRRGQGDLPTRHLSPRRRRGKSAVR